MISQGVSGQTFKRMVRKRVFPARLYGNSGNVSRFCVKLALVMVGLLDYVLF